MWQLYLKSIKLSMLMKPWLEMEKAKIHLQESYSTFPNRPVLCQWNGPVAMELVGDSRQLPGHCDHRWPVSCCDLGQRAGPAETRVSALEDPFSHSPSPTGFVSLEYLPSVLVLLHRKERNPHLDNKRFAETLHSNSVSRVGTEQRRRRLVMCLCSY